MSQSEPPRLAPYQEECVPLASSLAFNSVLEGYVPLASELQSSGGHNTLLHLPVMGDYSIVSSFFFFFFIVVDVAMLAIGLRGDGQERVRDRSCCASLSNDGGRRPD